MLWYDVSRYLRGAGDGARKRAHPRFPEGIGNFMSVELDPQVVRTGLPDASRGVMMGGAISAAGNVAGAGLNLLGGWLNRRWSEKMANTAYQRQVADMRKAGLNPILAAMKGGGADTPSAPIDYGGGGAGGAGEAVGGAVRESAKLNAIEQPMALANVRAMNAATGVSEAQTRQIEALTPELVEVQKSNALVNRASAGEAAARAAQVIQDTKAHGKGGKFLGDYLPKKWLDLLPDWSGGNNYGGKNSAK